MCQFSSKELAEALYSEMRQELDGFIGERNTPEVRRKMARAVKGVLDRLLAHVQYQINLAEIVMQRESNLRLPEIYEPEEEPCAVCP